MKLSVLAAGIGVFALAGFSPGAPSFPVLRKDRAAVMIYDGKDRVISVVAQHDSANLALILLHQFEGSNVPVERLAGRPCIGVALFSKSDWARLMADGRKPEDIKPSETPMRKRVYPASGPDSAAVFDIATGRGNVAAAFYAWDEAATTKKLEPWSVKVLTDKATGPCTVE
jgi:hypothetical protein